jgi:S1-C subfamily serine protease
MFVGPTPSPRKPEETASAPEVETQPVPGPAVTPPPAPGPVEVVQEPTGSVFEMEDGVFATTASGAEYLEQNYEEILKQTRTEPYTDRDGTSGVRIVNFTNQALATQFGIRKGDVIIKINGIPVRDQSQAVNVIKQELKKKGSSPILRVTVKRLGDEKELRFDTRDPATRRAAKKAFGK